MTENDLRTDRQLYVGIDYGTTNTESATMCENDTRPRMFALGERSNFPMSSALFFNQDGTVMVGDSAKRNAAVQPERGIVSPKRFNGTDKRWIMGDREVTPWDAATMILERAISKIKAAFPGYTIHLTVTCPAHYPSSIRRNLRDAAIRAGVEDVSILNEPTAAALYYLQSNPGLRGQPLLVYDLGGGTFDVTIMDATMSSDSDGYRVLASDGVEYLGGDDFTAAIYRRMIEKASQDTGKTVEEIAADQRSMYILVTTAEEVKHQLSEGSASEIIALPIAPDKVVQFEMTRQEFEDLTRDLVEKTKETVRKVVKDAFGEGYDGPLAIMMAGGASQMSQVQEAMREMFPGREVISKDPFEAIAAGAALYGAMGLSITEVLSETFGCSAINKKSERLICCNHLYKGTPIPCERTLTYGTRIEGQTKLKDTIYSSLSEDPICDPEDCAVVGVMEMTLPPSLPRGTEISTTFTIGEDGILTVRNVCAGVEGSDNFVVMDPHRDSQEADPFRLD